MIIILAETLHGTVRVIFIAPVIGDLTARQIGAGVGSLIVFIVAWFTVRWIAAGTRRRWIAVGVLWVALTVTFEVLLGLATGASFERITSDYDPTRGGLMSLGLAFMAFAPWLAARLRR